MSVRDLLNLQRRQLMALAENGSVKRLRSVYEDARRDLETRLRAVVKGKAADSFTAHHLRLMLVQVNDVLASLQKNMAVQLIDDGQRASTLAQRHLFKSISDLEKRYTGLTPVLRAEEAGVMKGLIPGVDRALLDRYKSSIRTYGSPVVKQIRDELATSILLSEPVHAAVDRIASTGGIFEQQRWRAERIVRTETAYAYGVTKQRGLLELKQRDFPDLQKKLVATFDSRTGEDSKELHGQTVPVDQPFIWQVKDSKGVVKKTVRYMAPPNRPNDREVVIPWRPGWTETVLTEPV